jgi:hypothetical protein
MNHEPMKPRVYKTQRYIASQMAMEYTAWTRVADGTRRVGISNTSMALAVNSLNKQLNKRHER